jgi:hypothetical protein
VTAIHPSARWTFAESISVTFATPKSEREQAVFTSPSPWFQCERILSPLLRSDLCGLSHDSALSRHIRQGVSGLGMGV